MTRNKLAGLMGACLLATSGVAFSAPESFPPAIVPLSNGGQANIAVSNTDANLFQVAGDRIIAINSLDGELTRQEQTASGGVVIATLNKKPFTFIVETERGLNFSIRAVPRAGEGRTIQLVSELSGTGEASKAWEESAPYESLLVTLNRSVQTGKLPEAYQSIPVTHETLRLPSGLQATPERVWVGHHLKVVRYSVTNLLATSRDIKETDFWQPGTRAIMLAEPTQQIVGHGRLQVYVTTSEESR
ncbi:MAG: type-F conjugative transfer system secretin TraK [Acinetobacter sp.]